MEESAISISLGIREKLDSDAGCDEVAKSISSEYLPNGNGARRATDTRLPHSGLPSKHELAILRHVIRKQEEGTGQRTMAISGSGELSTRHKLLGAPAKEVARVQGSGAADTGFRGGCEHGSLLIDQRATATPASTTSCRAVGSAACAWRRVTLNGHSAAFESQFLESPVLSKFVRPVGSAR